MPFSFFFFCVMHVLVQAYASLNMVNMNMDFNFICYSDLPMFKFVNLIELMSVLHETNAPSTSISTYCEERKSRFLSYIIWKYTFILESPVNQFFFSLAFSGQFY